MIKTLSFILIFILALTNIANASPNNNSEPSLETVNVITFQGGWNLPLWVAQEKGFFKNNSLKIDISYTKSSPELIKGLLDNHYNIAIAGIDNVIAYQEGQGAIAVNDPDMFAFYGVDNGLLSLVTNNNIKNINDLKGKKVSVDALNTSYAFVIKNYLEQNGVTQNDVEYSSVGSTHDRFNALLAGTTDATLLRTPFNLQAKAKGLTILASGNQLGDYQGTVGIATRTWASANEDVLIKYIRSYVSALNWLYDTNNQQEAEDILVNKSPGMDKTLAKLALQELLYNGLQHDAMINPKGVKNVMLLRSKLANPQKALSDENKYFDNSYYQKAIKN